MRASAPVKLIFDGFQAQGANNTAGGRSHPARLSPRRRHPSRAGRMATIIREYTRRIDSITTVWYYVQPLYCFHKH